MSKKVSTSIKKCQKVSKSKKVSKKFQLKLYNKMVSGIRKYMCILNSKNILLYLILIIKRKMNYCNEKNEWVFSVYLT